MQSAYAAGAGGGNEINKNAASHFGDTSVGEQTDWLDYARRTYMTSFIPMQPGQGLLRVSLLGPMGIGKTTALR